MALASKVQALALRDEALALRFWPWQIVIANYHIGTLDAWMVTYTAKFFCQAHQPYLTLSRD